MHASKGPRIWMIVLCIALAATGCAEVSTPAPAAPTTASTATPQPLPSGIAGENLVTATARVTAIDLQTRRVALERADGSAVTIYADDSVRNLPQVVVGDEVTTTYYESLAYEVKRPGTTAPGASVREDTARAPAGEKPAAAGTRVTTIVATITGIDKADGTVTAQERRQLTKAHDPRNLDRVVVNDLVEITYTEAVAISVEKAGK